MNTFQATGISEPLIRALAEMDIHTPTPIQQQAIPRLLNQQLDFIGLARTGTGKTAAFGLPLLHNIIPGEKAIQALVLAPTRELGQQLTEQLSTFARYLPAIRIEAICGGAPVKPQIKALKQGVQIVVATPGRLIDLLKQQAIDLSHLKQLVLDEADEMLRLGFRPALDEIIHHLPAKHASWLFSATMSPEVNKIVNAYMQPERLELRLNEEPTTSSRTDHHYLLLDPIEKLDILLHFLQEHEEGRGIIFCRTKASVQKLAKQLAVNRFSAGALHGDLPQGLRDRIMGQFREEKIKILVATDLAARGIDVDDLAFIIHYHLPELAEVYTHRSGRTARAGKSGSSLTFVFPEELNKLKEIEQELGISIRKMEKPRKSSIEANQVYVWARKILKTKPAKEVDKELKEKVRTVFQHLSKDELIDRLLADQLMTKPASEAKKPAGTGYKKK